MKPVHHIIGSMVIPDAEIIRVEWNVRGMLVVTTLGNIVVRGESLLQLLPDFLSRRALTLQVGLPVEPSGLPIAIPSITDIRSAPDLPVSTQFIPDLLLDIPARFVGFQTPSRLILAQWDDLLAAGWRRKAFWFALSDMAYIVTPLVEIATADRMAFLKRILASREPNHFAAGLSADVIRQYSFYDFADENGETATRIKDIAQRAYAGLGFTGPARIDFRVSAAGEAKVMEVTCKPHLTAHTSFMHAIRAMDRPYSDLLKFLVGSAAERLGLAHSAAQN